MQVHRKLLISAALAFVLLITLLAGLKPKGYRFRNDVTWIPHNGIGIGPVGIAYSGDSLHWIRPIAPDSGFTIEMSVRAKSFQRYGIAEILGFWDGTSPEPLMIGQLKNDLIIRVRDAHNKKGFREFGADTILDPGKWHLIQIVSCQTKTSIYDNGVQTGESLFTSIVPMTGLRGRLILGNSAAADQPWSGEINGIALFQRKLSPEEMALRFRQWNSSGRASLPPATRGIHFFQFGEGNGIVAHDCITPGYDLQIPPLFHIIKKRVLTGPWEDFKWDRSYIADVIINLFGFIPLGFILSLFLLEVASVPFEEKNLILTIVICFVISLCIELAQVFIPTRSSQLSDLIVNTLGGAAGGFLAKMIRTVRGS